MLAEIGRYLGTDRLVTAIHHGDLQAMHNKITKSGRPVRANRISASPPKCSAFRSAARRRGQAVADNAAGNPCRGVRRNHEQGREKFFSPAELAKIGDALNEYPNQTAADCVRLTM